MIRPNGARWGETLAEVVRASLTQPVPGLLIATLVAMMCTTTLLTVGRTAEAHDELRAQIEASGSRTLRVTDVTQDDLIGPGVLAAISGMSTVDTVIGTGIPSDVTASPSGAGPVTAWPVHGDLDMLLELEAGRWPTAGEALVSAHAQKLLGLDQPLGVVVDRVGVEHAVVGRYRLTAAAPDLEDALVVHSAPGPVRTLTVQVDDASAAAATQIAVLATIAAPQPTDLTVQSPATIAGLQASVAEGVGTYGRGMLVLVLASGGFLVAVVVLADTLLRRADLGRRRALGATRGFIVLLVAGRTLLAGATGMVAGSVIAVVHMTRTGHPPDLAFVVSVGVVALIAAGLGALPPAVSAARRDPLGVLRTP